METRSSTFHSALLALVALALLTTPAIANDEEYPLRTELGIQGGLFLPDDNVTGKNDTLRELEAVGGFRFGWFFARHFGLSLDGLYSDYNSELVLPMESAAIGDIDAKAVRLGIEVLTKPYWTKTHWFFGLGGGYIDYGVQTDMDFDRQFASLSLGQRVALDRRARFRWELRGDRIFEDRDLADGKDLTQINGLLAITWGLGRLVGDEDGDGVNDRKDDCPNTPRGATVDERGCPKDSDGDGVYDGIDRCPDTPRGATVDEWGCPKDSDGDGVYDGIDRCPNTPRGATVDEWGCPKDSDGDGVYDGIDRCPNTPRGAIVDEWGCPKDSDGDGVYDGIDKCPGTPKGVEVGPDGCPKAQPLFEEDRKTLILEGVFFEFDKDVLKSKSAETLDRVAESLLAWPEVRVEIAGHTDWIGTDQYNQDLSNRRAASVRRYLIGKGVSADRMESNGYGESRPIAPNSSEEGRSKNRRVELVKLD